ncbi:MAG: DUF697 domain-containing protein [Planctomycetaceae bacterium]|nr:DUF697 domain-containing protein [Planctomycetaceae bacterium]
MKSWFGFTDWRDAEFERERDALLAHAPIPVFGMLGKTGSGKSSIVRYLTGATAAEIGNGFRPQTRISAEFDFPDSRQPVVKFLDTRGLGEAGYDATDDIKAFGDAAHLVLVTVRATDHALDPVLGPLRIIREAYPLRPVVLALTCLHEAYPQQQHPAPDPFTAETVWPAELPGELRRCLVVQEARFKGLVDRIVPIDLTPPDEGFTDPHFGGERLERALLDALPSAYRQTLVMLHEVREQLQDLTERKAWPVILSYSSLAATAAAAPVPWLDIPIVLGLQSRLVYLLADLYGQPMQAQLLGQMAGALGGQLAARFAVRAPLKFLPVIGQTANAALAFAYTFSLGKACCWYFGEVRAGHVPTEAELSRVWNDELQHAVAVWKRRGANPAKVDEAIKAITVDGEPRA